MANALRREAIVPMEQVIHDLETSKGRPDAALRNALPHAAEISPLVIELVEKAADGVYLIPRRENLLFWGIHVLAAARCTELYRPLLRLIREQDESRLDWLLGYMRGESLPRILLSTFDGDGEALLAACTDGRIDGATRWNLIVALARLAFDGAIPRSMAVDFLDRFEREPLAGPGDLAWTGWQEAIMLLRLEEMAERVRATWRDGRNPQREPDQRDWDKQLTLACALSPEDPGLFVRERHVPIDDPVEALNWIKSEEAVAASERRIIQDGPFGPDPAEILALRASELDWLDGFLCSKHVPANALSLEKVDGLFCGLIAGPGNVSPGEAFAAVWGPGETADARPQPAYDGVEQAEYVSSLLARHWNTIAHRLKQDYPHSPVLSETDDDEAAAWAVGFLRAVTMRMEAWAPRRGEPAIGGFLAALLGLTGYHDILRRSGDEESRDRIVQLIPRGIRNAHHLWHGPRDPFLASAARHAKPSKVGRNEPCPCGSGKKYKRCCGSADKQAVN